MAAAGWPLRLTSVAVTLARRSRNNPPRSVFKENSQSSYHGPTNVVGRLIGGKRLGMQLFPTNLTFLHWKPDYAQGPTGIKCSIF